MKCIGTRPLFVASGWEVGARAGTAHSGSAELLRDARPESPRSVAAGRGRRESGADFFPGEDRLTPQWAAAKLMISTWRASAYRVGGSAKFL